MVMRLIRAFVAAAVIGSALPAAAQQPVENKRGGRQEVAHVRTTVVNYSGIFGRFIYGRAGIGWPAVNPRIAWTVDEFIAEGRPLGFSPSAYGQISFARPHVSWSGWPYVAGVDAKPRSPSLPKAESEAALREGRARWRAGDQAGALAAFKKAVANDLASGVARLHMALALLAAGDLRNADRAVESALAGLGGPDDVATLKLDELFRNAKEREKFEVKLFTSKDGAGALAVALAQHLLGMKEKAKALLDKSEEPAAKKLAELLR